MSIFYDFNVAPRFDVVNALDDFAFSGACIFFDDNRFDEESIDCFNRLNDSSSLSLYYGVRLSETNPTILRRKIQSFSKRSDLIMVDGTNSKINRVICESPQVDVINRPYLNKHNSGINHILANLLVENNISVNINLCDILYNRGFYKSKILNQINQLLMLQRKYGFMVILSSGSKSFFDVRSPKSMILLSQIMDMDIDYAKKAISDNPIEIIENINKRKKSIVDGVKIIDD